jgi:hypothetical protein
MLAVLCLFGLLEWEGEGKRKNKELQRNSKF